MDNIIQPIINENLTVQLQQYFTMIWQRYLVSCNEQQVAYLTDTFFLNTVSLVWIASEFCSDYAIKAPGCFYNYFAAHILKNYAEDEYQVALQEALALVSDEEQLMCELRLFRNQEMLRIIWREISGLANFEETVRDLSNLADACITLTLDKLYQWHCQKYGKPGQYQGHTQNLLVIALGKLGGRELNLSSDVDLLFCYPSKGETIGVNKNYSHEQFFLRLAQHLIRILETQTVDGFVFRVDMRLRPYGQSGALVMDLNALENYYQHQGRTWERFALLKARIITGHDVEKKRLKQVIQHFVYRSYVDFGVIEDLRNLKIRINREVASQNLHNNIKRGSGGIREVEFVVYAMQLIRGGKDTKLQQGNFLFTLTTLQMLDIFPADVVNDLRECYYFLRKTENCLQAFRDLQTQELPDNKLQQQRLAVAMQFPNYEDFLLQLNTIRQKAAFHFDYMIAISDQHDPDASNYPAKEIQRVIDVMVDASEAIEILAQHGFVKPDKAYQLISQLLQSHRYQIMTDVGQVRLEKLLPILLYKVGKAKRSDDNLLHVIRIVEAVMRRSSYLALLYENPLALDQLVRLCHESDWIADQLARYPALLDDLLDTQLLHRHFSRQDLVTEIEQQLCSIPQEDLEQQLACLCHFKLSHMLRIAARDITNSLPVVQVSDALTMLAIIVLQQVENIAWQHLGTRYGYPCDHNGHEEVLHNCFAILAYGKLASSELGYGSDLDLVFLHQDKNINLYTNGKKAISNAQFYLKFGQLILSLLKTHTVNGVLYDIDTRLRPSGQSGLLVTSLQAFADYQMKSAWLWEHQALIRSRIVSDSPQFTTFIEKVRHDVIAQVREHAQLRSAIIDMRARMLDSHCHSEKGLFHLKFDKGGITDIEFIVQYAVLRWSQQHPKLLEYTDNSRILSILAQEQLLAVDVVGVLSEIYQKYRNAYHHLSLQQAPYHVVAEEKFAQERKQVIQMWQQLIESEIK
jgi:[glutamine synthetase] adenylyltransferase / [glutamine synthetase]-adenylyl-L-tyrosine phosphorylase